jgi:FMN-dependent oxidoreductase (nitrilotriacetate monooxygenase family)
VVTSFDTGASRNFGLEEHLDYATRYGRALEFVQVARGLWDSYEDDAFPADVENNVFLDPEKLHELNHEGEHFRVAGPLNISRSPQGQPVIFQAGVSEEGRNLAAQVAEGIYAPGGSVEQAQEYYADIKRRTAEAGRDPEHIKVFIHGGPVVAATNEAAQRRDREIYEEDNDFDRNLALLGRSFGAHDFSQYDLDAPFPDVAHLAERGGRTAATKLIERARANNLTLRQVAQGISEFRRSPFVGDPYSVADTIEQWFAAGTFDGINLAFRTTDELERFVDGVVPILQARGLFRTEYEADTLRGNLGLPIPANRYAREHELASV